MKYILRRKDRKSVSPPYSLPGARNYTRYIEYAGHFSEEEADSLLLCLDWMEKVPAAELLKSHLEELQDRMRITKEALASARKTDDFWPGAFR